MVRGSFVVFILCVEVFDCFVRPWEKFIIQTEQMFKLKAMVFDSVVSSVAEEALPFLGQGSLGLRHRR